LLWSREGGFHCCSKGSVSLDGFDRDIPEPLLRLLQDPSFRKSINAYNTLLSMASASIERDDSEIEPPVCLLNGNISHRIGDLKVDR
jgi:hypothetical protein